MSTPTTLVQLCNGVTRPTYSVHSIDPRFQYTEQPELIEARASLDEFTIRSKRTVEITIFAKFLPFSKTDKGETMRLLSRSVALSEEISSLEDSPFWDGMEKVDRENISDRMIKMKDFLRKQEIGSKARPTLAVAGGQAVEAAEDEEEQVFNQVSQEKYAKRLRYCQKRISALRISEEFVDLQSLVSFLVRNNVGEDASTLEADILQIQAATMELAAQSIIASF